MWPDPPAEVGTEVNFFCVYRGQERNPNAVRIEVRPRGTVRVTDTGHISQINTASDDGVIVTSSKLQYSFKPSEYNEAAPSAAAALQVGDDVEFVLLRDLYAPRIVAVDIRKMPPARKMAQKGFSSSQEVRLKPTETD